MSKQIVNDDEISYRPFTFFTPGNWVNNFDFI